MKQLRLKLNHGKTRRKNEIGCLSESYERSEHMTTLPKLWKFSTLPAPALENILTIHVMKEDPSNLFNNFLKDESIARTEQISWCTESYAHLGEGFQFNSKITTKDLKEGVIKPRVEKTKEEQKNRVKAKAEVFTPMWVCNLQNNLADNEIKEELFNTISEDLKTWEPTISPIVWPENYSPSDYLLERRLEIACGEAPYLMSQYDATSGEYFTVRNSNNRFQRVGLLDRKFRVINENSKDLNEWLSLSDIAMKTIYGFEWQGDNLILARLNFINTFFDYLQDFIINKKLPSLSKERLDELAIYVSEIASWQLWQMDGLKQITPESCSTRCDSCKKRLSFNHDGVKPVLRWGNEIKIFEDFLK